MAYKKSNLSSGEQIVHVAHKHIIVLLRAAIQWIALFIFALIVAIFISTYNPPPGEASQHANNTLRTANDLYRKYT